MRVKVYRNLRHGRKAPPLYSVMYKGRVISRLPRVMLCDVKFIVSEAGRQRVLREHRKNVHAFVEGILVDDKGCFGQDANGPDLPMQVTYNPLKAGHFVAWGCRVNAARAVLLNERGMTACYLE